MHLRRAAQRVRILHAAAVGVARRPPGCRRAARAGAPRRARGPAASAARAAARRTATVGALERLQRERGRDHRRVEQPRARLAPPGAPAAAIRWVPLISARPSLAASSTGSSPARASASAPGQPLALVVASPSPISTSARCASGARSPEEPTEPLLGITGSTSRSSSPCDQLDQLDAHAGVPARAATRRAAAASRAPPRPAAARPTPTACERTRLSCSCAASPAAMRTSARWPKPVVTP